MSVKRIVPNLFDDDPRATRDFYADVFELDTAMDMGWIATLAAPENRSAQVSIFQPGAEEDRDPFVSIEVDDVDAVHTRARELGYEVVYKLRDPGGRVVNVLSHA